MHIREFDQLKTVLALYEHEVEQHLSQPNCQKLKTMVKRCTDQTLRARNFEARNATIETGVLVKTRQGKHVSVEQGNMERVINGKNKDSARRETLAVSATLRIRVEKQHTRLLMVQNRRLQTTGQVFREEISKTVQKTTTVDIVRIRHVIFGILPGVNTTKHNRDAHSVKSASLCTERLTVSLTRNRKNGGKGSVVLLKNSKQLGCVFQDIEPPKSKSILRKGTTFLGPKCSGKFSKWGSIPTCKFSILIFMSVAPCSKI